MQLPCRTSDTKQPMPPTTRPTVASMTGSLGTLRIFGPLAVDGCAALTPWWPRDR